MSFLSYLIFEKFGQSDYFDLYDGIGFICTSKYYSFLYLYLKIIVGFGGQVQSLHH